MRACHAREVAALRDQHEAALCEAEDATAQEERARHTEMMTALREEHAAATKAAFNLNGGYVEYDLVARDSQPGVIPNVYTIFPSDIGDAFNRPYAEARCAPPRLRMGRRVQAGVGQTEHDSEGGDSVWGACGRRAY